VLTSACAFILHPAWHDHSPRVATMIKDLLFYCL